MFAAVRAGASGFLVKDGRLLTKLRARDRAQLVIAAYESGLINGTDRR